MGGAAGPGHGVDEERVGPRQAVEVELEAAAALGRGVLKRRHPVVGGVVCAFRTKAAFGPVGGAVLHLGKDFGLGGRIGKDGTAGRRRPHLNHQRGGCSNAVTGPCARIKQMTAVGEGQGLGERAGSVVGLVRDGVIDVDDPGRNGTGTVWDGSYLDLCRI